MENFTILYHVKSLLPLICSFRYGKNIESFLGALAKLRKPTIRFCQSVRLPFGMEQLG